MAPKLDTERAKQSERKGQTSHRGKAPKAAPKEEKTERKSLTKLPPTAEVTERASSGGVAGGSPPPPMTPKRAPTLKPALDLGGKGLKKLKPKKAAVENAPTLETEEDFDWGKGGGWTVEKWCESLDVHAVVAAALEVPSENPYDYCKNLTKETIAERLRNPALVDGLIELIAESVENLSTQVAATGADLNKKFHMDGGGFEMAFGSLDLFFGGLETVIGPPQMIDGSLYKAMRAEHCDYKDANREFSSANGVKTTSAAEWEFCAEPNAEKAASGAYPDRAHFVAAGKKRDAARAAAEEAGEGYVEPAEPDHRRKVRPVEAFEVDVEEVNARLRKLGHVKAQLIWVEALAGRLYTGPMYEKYNAALRAHSGVQYLVEKARDLTKGNNYATTIHAINSCVIKLSKLTPAVKVWRGFKGATLPKAFFQPNESGVRGGIEYGFSSTTTDRTQAISYAQGEASTIFEMQMGMVDRGADLSWLSQYPHEKEVLFPPLTGLEALETEVDGSSLLIITRLSLNMTSLTLDEVVSRRRKTLMDMADGMKMEVEKAVADRHQGVATKILAKAIEWGHLQQSPEWFNNDDNFSLAVQQALGVKQGVIKAASKLPLDVTNCSLQGWQMSHPGRRLIFAGWLRCKPAAASIDLREASLTPEEAESLAKSVDACPKLVTLNVLKNESMGVEGAAALADSLAASSTLRSLCGIMPTNNTLEVPRKGLSQVDAMLIAAEVDSQNWTEQAGAAESKVGSSKLVRRSGGNNSTLGMSWHPLIWAAKEGNPSICEQLIKRGHIINANEDPAANAGFTPLMWAAYRGHAQVIDMLLDQGADPTMENNAGRNAAALAEMRGFKAIAELLLFVSSQVKQDKQSFGDAIRMAGLIKQASKSFKNVVVNASQTVAQGEGDPVKKVNAAASKLQALSRGKSMRNVMESVTAKVEDSNSTQVSNLAKQALLTATVSRKLKSAVMPKPRGQVGFMVVRDEEKLAAADAAATAAEPTPPPPAAPPLSKAQSMVAAPATESPPKLGDGTKKSKSAGVTIAEEKPSKGLHPAVEIQRAGRGQLARQATRELIKAAATAKK